MADIDVTYMETDKRSGTINYKGKKVYLYFFYILENKS